MHVIFYLRCSRYQTKHSNMTAIICRLPCKSPLFLAKTAVEQQARASAKLLGFMFFVRCKLQWQCGYHWHQWSSGRIHCCHRCDPGSIPGWCIYHSAQFWHQLLHMPVLMHVNCYLTSSMQNSKKCKLLPSVRLVSKLTYVHWAIKLHTRVCVCVCVCECACVRTCLYCLPLAVAIC